MRLDAKDGIPEDSRFFDTNNTFFSNMVERLQSEEGKQRVEAIKALSMHSRERVCQRYS